ncbi:MAG: flagellar basal body L-ring protein FlgH [Alphaproteobacteria bacterium]|nr:flagellar basal body L-ring protein FlgH [Alphaproteobacteria bacterium]
MIQQLHTAFTRIGLGRALLITVPMLGLSACADKLDRLSHVGEEAPLTALYNPGTQPGSKPLTWPLPREETPPLHYANSLWQQGSNTFFRDQRASRVGDILKVVMNLKDKGKLENSTDRTRTGNENLGVAALFGLEKIIPGQGGPSGTLSLNSNSTTQGDGQIERKEEIQTQFAATVTQVLANGNLVIDGRQEIRINDEVRAISVQGVVRPEDIGSSNTIDYSLIAEARISYGGRGFISDAQRPRYGQEVVDVISPF